MTATYELLRAVKEPMSPSVRVVSNLFYDLKPISNDFQCNDFSQGKVAINRVIGPPYYTGPENGSSIDGDVV